MPAKSRGQCWYKYAAFLPCSVLSPLLQTVQGFDELDVLRHESAFSWLLSCANIFSSSVILLAFPLLELDTQLWFAAALDWYTGNELPLEVV